MSDPSPTLRAHGASASGDGRRDGGPAIGAPGALLVIISGPSGVGKDTIIEVLRRRHPAPERAFVVTCTTRPPRSGEVADVSYRFLSPESFADLRGGGELLEFAHVHGHWYGTPRDQVVEALSRGRDAVLKIDVQGARAIKERVPDAVLIFIVPPTLQTLFSRLRARATESADELETRQRNAAIELARQEDYDYVVVNETGRVEHTAEEIDRIIAAEKARHRDRRIRL